MRPRRRSRGPMRRSGSGRGGSLGARSLLRSRTTRSTRWGFCARWRARSGRASTASRASARRSNSWRRSCGRSATKCPWRHLTSSSLTTARRSRSATPSRSWAWRWIAAGGRARAGRWFQSAEWARRKISAAAAVDGAIAVVARGTLRFTAKLNNAVAAGAVGLIVVNTEDQLYAGRLEADSDVTILGVSLSDGERLRRLAGEQATIAAWSGGQRSSWNVVARQPGGVCRVVVGGHYDTVPNVTGANDNASGTATVVGAGAGLGGGGECDRRVLRRLRSPRSWGCLVRSRSSTRRVIRAGWRRSRRCSTLDAFGDGNRPLTAVGDAELTAIAEGDRHAAGDRGGGGRAAGVRGPLTISRSCAPGCR